MANIEKQDKAIDLSHHLSVLSKSRQVSPLKQMAKYFGKEGLISLAGGTPHPSYFPYAEISANALVPEAFSLDAKDEAASVSWFWKLLGAGAAKEKTTPITVPKYPKEPTDVNLALALQYGTAQGLIQLQKFIKEFVGKVYQPAFSDWAILMDTGNTDGWSRAAQTFCNPGELFLTEEWTYPSALASAQPYGLKPVGIAMDSEGMRTDALRKVLSEWDEEARGAKRPHVMYTVPVGQNPSGATMGLKRKQEIYDVCVEFDVLIVEDDPYYFLQEGEYKLKSERVSSTSVKHDSAAFIAGLAPSFLKIDTQGRVIRLDTFSKTIAPGSRLGFFTCNPLFAERLERHGETTTQAPCGFGQSLVTKLFETWGYEGYMRWLHGLTAQYTERRNAFIDALAEEFHLTKSIGKSGVWHGMEVYQARTKLNRSGEMSEKYDIGSEMFSFVPPTSGMFVWVKMNFDGLAGSKRDDNETLEIQLWTKLADAGVLLAPGWFFSSDRDHLDNVDGHYRIAFSSASTDDFRNAAQIMGKVFTEFYKK